MADLPRPADYTTSQPADDPETLEIEAEIRAHHQPRRHTPTGLCPTGTCCQCGDTPCDTGTTLAFLDVARTEIERLLALNENIRQVRGILRAAWQQEHDRAETLAVELAELRDVGRELREILDAGTAPPPHAVFVLAKFVNLIDREPTR